MSVLSARPPGFAAGINGSRRSHLRIGQIARQTSPRLFVSLPVRLRPHRESKPPSHPGGGESPPNPNRQKLLGQALSRRAEQLAKELAPHRVFSARRISKEAMHPAIREDVWALYHRG